MAEDKNFSDDVAGARLALIGGFLGAGKTTLIGRFVNFLQARGLRAGLVTNDQGKGLIDTQSARRLGGAAVAEVTGGCFCCKLGELVAALEMMEGESRPDVFVAEPVGSCTDLVATVLLPIRTIYKRPLAVAPLSVVLDGRRALTVLLGRRRKGDFHRDVGYVYRKQIEEAEWLVINKLDLLTKGELEDLRNYINIEYPGKKLFVVSGKTGEGAEKWFEELLVGKSAPDRVMDVDYQRYGDGEARLGWYNAEARCQISGVGEAEVTDWIGEVAHRIATKLDEAGCEVAHFKMALEAGERRWRVHQVMAGEEIEVIEEGIGDGGSWMGEGRLLINLRAEGAPDVLEAIVEAGLGAANGVKWSLHERAAFRPGQPNPTMRLAAV